MTEITSRRRRIWPVLSTPAGVFTKDYFAFWIFIAVIWALVASFIIIALPIWESKDQILAVARCAHTTFSRRRGTHTVHYPHPHPHRETSRLDYIVPP